MGVLLDLIYKYSCASQCFTGKEKYYKHVDTANRGKKSFQENPPRHAWLLNEK